jgi:hypothetical protein
LIEAASMLFIKVRMLLRQYDVVLAPDTLLPLLCWLDRFVPCILANTAVKLVAGFHSRIMSLHASCEQALQRCHA